MASTHPLLLDIIEEHGLEYESDELYQHPITMETTSSGIVIPRLINKPWGAELLKVVDEEFVKKILFINPNELLSIQYHEEKVEAMEEVAGGRGTLYIRPLEELLIEQGVPRPERARLLVPGSSRDILAFISEHYPTRESLFSALYKEDILNYGGEIHIKPFTIHTFLGITDLALAETSTPQIFDVVRVSDKYARED